MPQYSLKSLFPVPAAELYAWHMRVGALERLTPPWSAIQVTWGDEHVCEGSRRELIVPAGPFKTKWLARHHSIVEGKQFIDEQDRGPFRKWTHLHVCTDKENGKSELEDRIDYEFPLGKLGEFFGKSQVDWMLNTAFPWRHERTWIDLSRHAEFADRPRLKVAISGASGMIGSNLKHFLTTGGHEVLTIDRKRGTPNSVYWNPIAGEIESEKLEGLDAVVHLAGRNIAAGRWTETAKREILDSRVLGTRLLAETIAKLKSPPKVFISASAVGIYRSSAEPTDEYGPQGDTFLAEVCRAWEGAADAARAAGIRVVHPRIGTVISGWGGVLGKLLPVFKIGLGGRLGSGRQMMNWIQLDDLIAVFYRSILDDALRGPVNATVAKAVTNQEFTEILGRVLKRPTIAFVPEIAVNTVFGQMGRELLLEGSNPQPKALDSIGFTPWFDNLEAALRFETGKPFQHSPPFHPTPLPQSQRNGYLIS